MQLDEEPFTKLYDFIMVRKNLTLIEKLVLCRAIRFQDGWYESASKAAKWVGCSRRTLQRAVKSLVKKGELAPLYESKNKRILWPTVKDLPLFEYVVTAKRIEESVKK